MRELDLEVETLEKPLYVSSPLRARVSVDQIGVDPKKQFFLIILFFYFFIFLLFFLI